MGAQWLELTGVALLCGAGFTMSFFLGALAFPPSDVAAQGRVRAAVILGSLLSVALGGLLLLRVSGRRRDSLEAS